MSWKDRNVLITGVGGFVGSRLAMRLNDEGANVVGLVRNINSLPPTIANDINVLIGDICDYDDLCEAISFYEIDTIYHFAAYAIVRVSSKDPMTTYRVNVMGTANLLEAARNVGRVERIVVASSDKAYGDHVSLPYTENHSLQPRNTYDTSKACMDMVSRSYAWNYDMPIFVSRCSNIYGPGDMNLSRIIPNTIRRASEGKPPQLYSDVEKMKREFVYINDVIDAYLKMGDVRTNVFTGEAYNVGGTGEVEIYELVDKISKILGVEESPIVLPRDPLFKEIERQYIDASKLERDMKWKPTTSLDEGLHRTVDWYLDYYEKGLYK